MKNPANQLQYLRIAIGYMSVAMILVYGMIAQMPISLRLVCFMLQGICTAVYIAQLLRLAGMPLKVPLVFWAYSALSMVICALLIGLIIGPNSLGIGIHLATRGDGPRLDSVAVIFAMASLSSVMVSVAMASFVPIKWFVAGACCSGLAAAFPLDRWVFFFSSLFAAWHLGICVSTLWWACRERNWAIDYGVGHCVWCGYDLTALSSNICPECGRACPVGTTNPDEGCPGVVARPCLTDPPGRAGGGIT